MTLSFNLHVFKHEEEKDASDVVFENHYWEKLLINSINTEPQTQDTRGVEMQIKQHISK